MEVEAEGQMSFKRLGGLSLVGTRKPGGDATYERIGHANQLLDLS
jgi:hypothetical protein